MPASVLEFEFFPVDFPFAGNLLETIPAETASTAILIHTQAQSLTTEITITSGNINFLAGFVNTDRASGFNLAQKK